MVDTVIRTFQRLLNENFDQILAYNNISLNLYFQTLQPLEFTVLDNVDDMETSVEETVVKLINKNLIDEEFDIILDVLRGETISNRREAVDVREQSEDNEIKKDWAGKPIERKEDE